MEENKSSSEVNMEQVTLYYDHYKDTYEQLKTDLAKRNHLTLMLLIFATLLIGLLFDPSTFEEKINAIVGTQFENLVFDFHFINTGIILITFWLLFQYYLIVLHIEKMYSYLAECEKRLCKEITKFPINREGSYYLKSYPWLKDIADHIFVWCLPIGFIILSIAKIVDEISWNTTLRIVDFFILGFIIFLSFLYISNRKFKEEIWDKKRFTLKWYQRIFGYLRLKKYSENNESN